MLDMLDMLDGAGFSGFAVKDVTIGSKRTIPSDPSNIEYSKSTEDHTRHKVYWEKCQSQYAETNQKLYRAQFLIERGTDHESSINDIKLLSKFEDINLEGDFSQQLCPVKIFLKR